MTPISALAILFCIYAVSELIAQKTKAIFSTVLSIAILLLAGFWSGILPRTLIDEAQITGFGNIIAGLLIVSLGTTIDFAELRRQWKVVVTALCGVCGAVTAIVLIGRRDHGRRAHDLRSVSVCRLSVHQQHHHRRRTARGDLPGGTRSVHRHHVCLQADRREHRPSDPACKARQGIRR